MKITDAQIEAAKSPRGGFTRDTLAAWGVPWPPPKGWRRALVEGRPIPKRRRRRLRPNGRKRPKTPVNSSQAESLVFAVATFLLDRGHRDAAHDLATNPETAIAYLKQANVAAQIAGNPTAPNERKPMDQKFLPNDRVQSVRSQELGTCHGFNESGYLVVEWDAGETESYPPNNLAWIQKADTFLDDFLP